MESRWTICRTVKLIGAVSLIAFARKDQVVHAEEAPPLPHLHPHVCTGYDPVARVWGGKSSWSAGEGGDCAPGHAAVAAVQGTPTSLHLAPEDTPVTISCCPLPDGVLTSRHEMASGRCPVNTVVTGLRCDATDTPNAKCRFLLRCTAIDVSRFELGPAMNGAQMLAVEDSISHLKEELAKRFRRSPALRVISSADLPVALRYGVARAGQLRWELEATVGEPAGALLSEVRGNLDEDIFFRELRWRGSAGPGNGARPVTLFPVCRAISDPFSPTPECVP